MLRPKSAKNNENGFSFRLEVKEGDDFAIRFIMDSTGIFSREEVDSAEGMAKEEYNFIFCETEGKPIGFIIYGPLSGNFCIYNLAIEKSWHRKGIGGKLLEMLEAEALKSAAPRVYTSVSGEWKFQPAVSFFENRGYSECETHFDIDFPMTAKVSVKGDKAHPFYKWAKQTLGMLATPKWNFHKYLIAPDGHIADWFLSSAAPDSEKLNKAIEANLPAAAQ